MSSKKGNTGKSKSEEINYDAIVEKILSNTKEKRRSPMPVNLRPMLATLIDKPFDEAGWIYEVKWDGYRALAYLNKEKSDLRSRKNNSFNEQFYPVYQAIQLWPIKAIVDGEIVVVNEQGLSSFSALQQWRSEADGELIFYVFDILWLNGYDLMNLDVVQRRNILKQLTPTGGIIKFSENFEVSGTDFFDVAQQLQIEGMIAKKVDSTYVPNIRTKSWYKIKTGLRHEAVITGITRNHGSSKKFSALVLGVYDDDGELKFIGQVGTGFTDKMQVEILKKLDPLKTPKCPFNEEPIINKPTRFRPNPPKASVTWVKPELVCEVRYQELTDEGIMRHPSFQGIRDDKSAREAVEEIPEPTTESTETSKGRKQITAKQQQTKKARKKTQEIIDKIASAGEHHVRKSLLNPKDEQQTRIIDGRELKFTNTSKIYWPKEKITKRDMLNYYYQVAPYILPYMKDRPQSLNRYPHGINGESFYQKNVAGKVPSWITKHDYENTTREGEKTFLVCSDEATLLYMANLGCIEMNPWHSRIQNPDNPDWCVIDLDPDTNPFEQVIEAAQVVKKILDAAEIPAFCKTSGSTGIHIYIPLGAKYDYDQSKQLAHLIVTLSHHEIPEFTSLIRSPSKRKGFLYLDYLQNRAIQTIAAPYSLRPKSLATASAPLHWDEVKPGLQMKHFTISTMPDRIKSEGDLFEGMLGKGIDLKKVLKKIDTVFG